MKAQVALSYPPKYRPRKTKMFIDRLHQEVRYISRARILCLSKSIGNSFNNEMTKFDYSGVPNKRPGRKNRPGWKIVAKTWTK